MSPFFSHLQNISGLWRQATGLTCWPGLFSGMLSESYRREDTGIRQLNGMLEMASRMQRDFLETLMKTLRPAGPPGESPGGVTVDQQPGPASTECQLPGG